MADRIIHSSDNVQTVQETAQQQTNRAVGLTTVPTVPAVEQRPIASMSRVDFCKVLWRQGLLPQSEAVQAARGEWPATFASFTAGLSADAAADAQIEWAGSVTIRYMAPTLQALALAHAGGDQVQATAILDQLFGIS